MHHATHALLATLACMVLAGRAAALDAADPLGEPVPVQHGVDPVAIWLLVSLAAALGFLTMALLLLLVPRRATPCHHCGARPPGGAKRSGKRMGEKRRRGPTRRQAGAPSPRTTPRPWLRPQRQQVPGSTGPPATAKSPGALPVRHG